MQLLKLHLAENETIEAYVNRKAIDVIVENTTHRTIHLRSTGFLNVIESSDTIFDCLDSFQDGEVEIVP